MEHKNNFLCERRFLAAITALLLFCVINTASAQTVLPAEDIAEKALAATVSLEMKDKSGKTLGIGSGFFVKPNLIATNYHVIEGAASGTAKLIGKYTTYNIEGITATDKTNDLALLKVTAYGIKPLPLGDSDTVRIGETVYVAGNPKGLEGTFSNGIISSRRDTDTKERLQMTAPISPGSSGGPVLNRKGEVIGVSFMTLEGGQNLNFAIPSKYLKTLLIHSGTSRPLGQNNVFISAETYFRWGYAKEVLGNHKGAIADYTESIRLESNAAVVYYNRANAKLKLGQYLNAINDYTEAIRLEPEDASAYSNRGIAKAGLGQHAAAIADFDMAIRLKPNLPDAHTNRGLAKYKLGQNTEAIADHNNAIRLKPNFALAYNNRGLAKDKIGRNAEAITDFDTAIRLKSDLAEAYHNRGNVKYELGRNIEAITDFDAAIRLKPDHADTYNNRGNVKGKLGQYAEAITDFDTAIRLKPDFALGYYNRGFAKSLLDRTWEAKQDFQTALRLAEKVGDARLKAKIESILQKSR